MTEQTVAQDTKVEAPPSTEAEGAQEKSLDDLLKEIPEAKAEPPKPQQPDPKVDLLEKRLAELEKANSATNAEKAVREFRDGGFDGVPDVVIKGFLNERLMESEKLRTAWVGESRQEVMRELRKELQGAIGVKPASNKKVASAVRSAQTVASDSKEEEDPHGKEARNIKEMTDAEFEAYKRKITGRSPRIL